jgi:glycosyltransferase involved in cell wall biosynthesis
VDQYLLFPAWLRAQVKRQPPDTLFVFTDQALGPWVPQVRHRPHVVHVHDLLALRSALGEVPQNPTRFTGRIYQRYIRSGFSQARHFICISRRTREELLRLGRVTPETCEVVHNGLNAAFAPVPAAQAHRVIDSAGLPEAPRGMVLHVSGNQWYKNVAGVIRIYGAYARSRPDPLPLWLVGVRPGSSEQAALAELPPQAVVRFMRGLSHEALQASYSLARAFLFPSHAEGFGWPIVEAQACGCPVITTDDAPMNEIGGPVTRYLPRLARHENPKAWAVHGAQVLAEVAHADAEVAERRSAAAVAWASRFRAEVAIQGYLRIYAQVLAAHGLDKAALATLTALRGG